MNIFKALSNILDAAVTTTVKACDVIDTSVSAIDNVAKMAERTTNAMVRGATSGSKANVDNSKKQVSIIKRWVTLTGSPSLFFVKIDSLGYL